jgi:hypothetical protein
MAEEIADYFWRIGMLVFLNILNTIAYNLRRKNILFTQEKIII